MTPQISQCIIDAAAAAVTITAALDTASRQPENPQQNNSHQHSSVPDGARGLLSLQSLDLWDGLPFTDTEIACILDALTVPLQVLSVPESGFGELATAALFRQPSSLSHAALVQAVAGDEAHSSGFEGLAGGGNSMLNTVPPDPPIVVHPGFYQRPPHAATLKRLDLTDCPDITDDTLQRIKDMCPVLKTLIVSTP
ncbi:hypothetical protein EDD11_008951 [Mortierella claussenii]|nr:hypothetical protein EDD11_008951 [Mortierella claussenii]